MSKIPLEDLERLITQAKADAAPGTKWRHYKGGEYVIRDIVVNEEDNALVVIYSPTKLPTVSFARPLSVWHEVIVLDNASKLRFTQI